MVTRIVATSIFCTVVLAESASAAANHQQEHGGQVFHAFRLEADTGVNNGGQISTFDLDGWVGTDENKLWIKGEAELDGSRLERSELWAMYSRNVAEFWDVQAGLRHDFDPGSITYAVVGVEGLAPYFFETEAHLFVSEDGDVSARIREENDFLLTQRLIVQPYGELNFAVQDVPEQGVGSGPSKVEFGIQTRYEFDRDFAPYVDLRYETKVGETATIAKNDGEERGGLSAVFGFRIGF